MYADKDIRVRNHGGIACYVKRGLDCHVFDIHFNESYMAFRLDYIPSFLFIGCYIQPENSRYFDPKMFSELSSLLLDAQERNLIIIMGGDVNCRFGNMNGTFEENLIYENNTDFVSNKHGRTYGVDMCKVGGIFPLNHLTHKRKVFQGDFTYFKGNPKSQIDFIYTTKRGLSFVKDLIIPDENWHLSDHRPVELVVNAPKMINCSHILKRAKELNYEFNPHLNPIKRHNKSYNFTLLEGHLNEKKDIVQDEILKELENCDINKAILVLDNHLQEAHKISKIKQPKIEVKSASSMEKANSAFENYTKSLTGQSCDTVEKVYERYQNARNAISREMYVFEHNKWKQLLDGSNPKKMWQSISWKGDVSKQNTQKPETEDLALHFENLYSSCDKRDIAEINDLKSEVYIPILDDPISQNDVGEAIKDMKRGGYDYSLTILNILRNMMSPILLLLFNIMFYVSYPVTLAKSLLIALPKKGNLLLPKNYRGIQMLAAIGALYDRIIAIRLHRWTGVTYEQSAFQKGKSTIHQLFTIRLIIEIAKLSNKTVYIGFFDLEKAFDKVSRLLLLKKLIKMGIGNCMLQALKRIYSFTTCVLDSGGERSSEFRTFTGIRQGAPSSVYLFIIFIDDLISYLKHHCIDEPLIGAMHCLLHADDTAIVSTDRRLFIIKCNLMLKYFVENSLSLNFSKSSYLIINGNVNDKLDLTLDIGKLEYKSVVIYLGAIISDDGNIRYDIEKYVGEKRANVTIKYNNFLHKNHLAPLQVKLKVLDACVASTIIYGCEAWGIANIPVIETIYRMGLKRAMSVRETVNTEIVYIESNCNPLTVRISKQQLSFWKVIQALLEDEPNHPLGKLIEEGVRLNVKYLKYYQHLENTYVTPINCQKTLSAAFKEKCKAKVRIQAEIDDYSRLGTYLKVNPQLIAPSHNLYIFEKERITISRYRCGSHNLKIETGRMCNPKIPREDRMCDCKVGVQSLHHCLLNCPLLEELYEEFNFTSIEEALNRQNITTFLAKMENVLKISS